MRAPSSLFPGVFHSEMPMNLTAPEGDECMAILLFLLWIILNGKITLEIVLFGVVLDALVLLAMTRLTNYRPKLDGKSLRNLPLMGAYFCVLLLEILKANFKVFGIVLSPRQKNEPAMVKVRIPLKEDWCRMLLANSITLTPGTITADVDGDVYTIHCLDRTMADGIAESRFVKLLRKMEV